MRVGFLGPASGLTLEQQVRLGVVLSGLRGVEEWHHGGEVGSDEEFHRGALDIGGDVVVHPRDRPRLLAGAAWGCCRVLPPQRPGERDLALVCAVDVLLTCPAAGWQPACCGARLDLAVGRCEVVALWPDGRVGRGRGREAWPWSAGEGRLPDDLGTLSADELSAWLAGYFRGSGLAADDPQRVLARELVRRVSEAERLREALAPPAVRLAG